LYFYAINYTCLRARIYKSTGSWYTAKDENGKWWNCRIKGKFKIDESITSTNPIAVGDEVELEIESEDNGTAQIEAITDRHNYIVRVSPHNKNQKHIVASNLDQAVLVATVAEPRTSSGFIDRFLVTCEAYHIPAILVFNKSDILKGKSQERFEEMAVTYAEAGYTILLTSVKENTGMEELNTLLKDKTTLFSGHSGVGKSSLINLLVPEKALKTQEVSKWSGKGLHTTTFAEMFDLPQGGAIIDTPGIRELGIVDIPKTELAHYFPEMRELMEHCQFNNCLHINEPGCEVKAALEEGRIAADRYISYLSILDTIEEKWK